MYLIAEGKEVISKETVEAVDKENQSMTYNIFEGDLMKLYKTMKVTFQITSEGDKNFLKWTYVYEKVNGEIPPPDQLKFFGAEVTNTVDAHYLSLKNKTDGA